MFRHPAWAVGSYSSGPPAAGTLRTKSPGGCYQADMSPCVLYAPYPAALLEVDVGLQSRRVAGVAGRRGGEGRVVRRDHVCLELLPARPPERAAVAAAQDSRLTLGRDLAFNTR